MSRLELKPVDQDGIPALTITPRLRSQLAYFGAAGGSEGVPTLQEGEYWFKPEEVESWLDEGVFHLVSPLDSENQTEVELTEEQEALLLWLRDQGVRHVRVVG
jgi:hypothetical protein